MGVLHFDLLRLVVRFPVRVGVWRRGSFSDTALAFNRDRNCQSDGGNSEKSNNGSRETDGFR